MPVPCASKLRCHCQLLPLTANMVVPTIAVDHQPMMGSARLLHMLLESAQLVHLLMACIIQSTSMCSIVCLQVNKTYRVIPLVRPSELHPVSRMTHST